MESLQGYLEVLQLIGGTNSIFNVLTLVGALFLYKKLTKMDNKFDLMKIDQDSMDYAIEKSFGNGYAGYRKEKKVELLGDREVEKGE
ncbi:MAG: hypothetical protein IAE90_07445 [Ignavibacteria bacterium]|nr:hypothetical protein [Ignavibacteria bacterium]